MTESLLKPYSLGYVTRDILEDNLYCDFFPVERMPGYSGIINDNVAEKATTTDIDGTISSVKIDRSVKITAKWFNNGDSNRLTPPNICKGETVMLYRYSNTDRYYWSTIYNELDLRKLEKATYVFSNKRTINDKSKLGAVYSFTIDTINKFVKLFTGDDDGELTTYDFEINTKDGIVTLIDGRGNMIQMDSSKDTYNVKFNVDYNLDITETTNETIGIDRNVSIGNNQTTDIANNHTTTVGNNQTTDVAKVMSETIGTMKVIKVPKISIKNDTADLITVLSDLIQANMDQKGIGNLGSPVPCDPGSVAAYQALKDKLDSFKV
jgi:hypothetical protein